MLKNYLKISFRNLLRHKLFSFINITGLMLSMAICLAAIIIIRNQLHFDEFHPDPEHTWRVVSRIQYEEVPEYVYDQSPLPIADVLHNEYNVAEQAVHVYHALSGSATANDHSLRVFGAFSEPSFFDLFGFELDAGNPETALEAPHSIILTRETADRFFGPKDPMGQSFQVEGLGEFTVTGILDLSRYLTHFRFDVLASFSTVTAETDNAAFREALDSWKDNSRNLTYFRTPPTVTRDDVERVLASLASRTEQAQQANERILSYGFDVQNISEITPGSDRFRRDMGSGKSRSAEELYMIALIAGVILAMACFNYTNLFIARSVRRSREVGIYKVFGASRSQIIKQFIVQATLISLFALVAAFFLLPFVPLSQAFQEEVRSATIGPELVAWFVLFAVVTGFIAGALPAWLLSSLSPVGALRNMGNVDLIKGFKVRKMLVVVQFTIAIILTIGTLVVYKQTHYTVTTDYGFRQMGIAHIRFQGADPDLLREQFQRIPDVERISATSNHLGVFAGGRVDIKREADDTGILGGYYSVDHQAVPNMELELVAGSNFDDRPSTEQESQILINERFAALLDFDRPFDAVGASVLLDDSIQVEIAGVLKDVHLESLSVPIRPTALRYRPDEFRYLNVRLTGNDRTAARARLHAAWDRLAPRDPFDVTWSDEIFMDAFGHREDIQAIGFYAFFLIVIAGLGLLGMVTYTVEVRTREVGIRKVLGATIPGVVALLSGEFALLLSIAGLLGLPVGFVIGQKFLSTYAYHVDMGVGVMAAGIGIMLVTGLLAIGLQTWRVAHSDPVRALQAE